MKQWNIFKGILVRYQSRVHWHISRLHAEIWWSKRRTFASQQVIIHSIWYLLSENRQINNNKQVKSIWSFKYLAKLPHSQVLTIQNHLEMKMFITTHLLETSSSRKPPGHCRSAKIFLNRKRMIKHRLWALMSWMMSVVVCLCQQCENVPFHRIVSNKRHKHEVHTEQRKNVFAGMLT